MKERRKSQPEVISCLVVISLPCPSKPGEASSNISILFPRWIVDLLMCLPGHQVKRNWEGWECGEAWGLQAGARSPFCSLVGRIHLGQIDTVKGSLDWIFFQMLPKRAGRPLSEEMAGTRGGGTDVESPPVALWGGWGDPEGVLGRSQEHLAVLCLCRE